MFTLSLILDIDLDLSTKYFCMHLIFILREININWYLYAHSIVSKAPLLHLLISPDVQALPIEDILTSGGTDGAVRGLEPWLPSATSLLRQYKST